ncbi:MAG: hypothetical protein CMG00_09330 [Candidatus Marinimicrobia bacterium]|nr:hypothetical protein [Candidatus Neomarinimicrobiota bacterium]|tara:strand:+ start:10513 stop:11952 length:1440 start_codon:yes stop_codon:yes gene_type:complete
MLNKLLIYSVFLLALLLPVKNFSTIEISVFNDIQYISAIDYANQSSMRQIFIENKEKLVIQYESKKIILSPNSSFILVSDDIYNLTLEIKYDGNDFWIPLNTFLRLIDLIDLPSIKIDSSERFVLVDAPKNNIKNCNISSKQNGTLITFDTDKFFDESLVSASITRGGWLNINIVGGSLDSLYMMENTLLNNSVLRMRPIQMEQSAQVSFLLKNDIEDYSISSKDKKITISLRSDIAINAQKIKEMKKRWDLDVIVLDPGHGGKDPGCLDNGLMEKTVVLDVAKKLGKMIEQELGIKVVYTRTEDEFIPLWKRTKIANDSGGKLFISLHVNASPNSKSAKGFETYFIRPGKFDDATAVAQRENKVIELEEVPSKYPKLNRENLIIATMAQASFTKQSEFFAGQIQKEFERNFTSPNRGVKQAGFHVLVGASMPNVLVELGFITNSQDYKLLTKSKYRTKMARSVFNAIVAYKNEYEQTL